MLSLNFARKLAVLTLLIGSVVIVPSFSSVANASDPVPGPVRHLVATAASQSSIDVIWQQPTQNADLITDYVVEYSLDYGAHWEVYNDGVKSTLLAIVENLPAATNFLIRVSAKIGDTQGPAVVAKTVSSIVSAPYHTCEILVSGLVYCWGLNSASQLGIGYSSAWQPISHNGLMDVKQLSAGDLHTCALKEDGHVWCWGWNGKCNMCHYNLDSGSGVLGDGANVTRPYPVEVTGITDAVAIGSGYRHNCAILASGEVKCWGASSIGQFGSMAVSDPVLTPTPIPSLSGAVALAGTSKSMCALMSNKTVKCWGNTVVGQLGNGYKGLYGNASKPSALNVVTVTGLSGVDKISAGMDTTCALTSTKHIYCWGSNYHGALGIGDLTKGYSAIPVEVSGISNAIDVSVGYQTGCAVLEDGTAKCWGDNGLGQFGTSSNSVESAPVTIGVTGVQAISPSMGYVCAIVLDGTVQCAGRYLSTGLTGPGARIKSATFQTVTSQAVRTLAAPPMTIATPTIDTIKGTSFYASFVVPESGGAPLTQLKLKVIKTSDLSLVRTINFSLRGLTAGTTVRQKISSLFKNTDYMVVATASNIVATSAETNFASVKTLPN